MNSRRPASTQQAWTVPRSTRASATPRLNSSTPASTSAAQSERGPVVANRSKPALGAASARLSARFSPRTPQRSHRPVAPRSHRDRGAIPWRPVALPLGTESTKIAGPSRGDVRRSKRIADAHRRFVAGRTMTCEQRRPLISSGETWASRSCAPALAPMSARPRLRSHNGDTN